jgi:hypothetical protein
LVTLNDTPSAPPEHTEGDASGATFARDLRLFDATMIGVGEIPEKVARYSPASVLIVKRYEGPVKSLVKQVLG